MRETGSFPGDLHKRVRFEIESAVTGEKLHPVIHQLLSYTLATDKSGMARPALAVEGGGMRSTTVGWMAASIEKLGEVLDTPLAQSFVSMDGTSGGAATISYFAGQNADAGKNVWHRHLAKGSDFIRLGRILKGKPPLSLDTFFNSVITKDIPLDWEKISSLDADLGFIASRVDTPSDGSYEPLVRLADFEDEADMRKALQASTRIPLYMGRKPMEYKGMSLWDGHVVEAIPVYQAEKHSDYVLTLVSIPHGFVDNSRSTLDWLLTKHISGQSKELGKLFSSIQERDRETREMLEQKQLKPDGPQYISTIAPPADAPLLKTTEQDPEILIAAGNISADAALQAFGVSTAEYRHSLIAELSTW